VGGLALDSKRNKLKTEWRQLSVFGFGFSVSVCGSWFFVSNDQTNQKLQTNNGNPEHKTENQELTRGVNV